MKKFRLALLGLAVVSMTALSSCGGGMTDTEADAAANDILNELNETLDSAMNAVEEVVVEEVVVEDTTATEEEVIEEVIAE